MSDKSERAYWWIDNIAERAGRWLDANIGRVLFAAGAAGLSIIGYRQPEGTFLNSISAELFGIVLTAVIIDYVNDRRQEKERKEILIAQLGSTQRDITELALIELRNRLWLYDGSLNWAHLWKANLSGASLYEANLSGASLYEANLSGANLEEADLRGANLYTANLTEAILERTNLRGATLLGAFLREANLSGANLNGADLSRANLSEAHLEEANLSGAYLMEANLSEAHLEEANLSGAYLMEANLSGANLIETDLSGAKNWTIEQLGQAETLEGTIMPDGTQLAAEEKAGYRERINGPTFEEWNAQYLAKYGGVESDIRRTNSEPDDAADGQAESGSPEPS